jgi:hypothetical protein
MVNWGVGIEPLTVFDGIGDRLERNCPIFAQSRCVGPLEDHLVPDAELVEAAALQLAN